MWELVWQLAIFFLGVNIGKARVVNVDITNQISHMQDLLNEAHEERDKYKIALTYAEQRAESWERRYNAVLNDKEEPNEKYQIYV